MAIGVIAQLKIAVEAAGVDKDLLPLLFKIKGGGVNRINTAMENLFLVVGQQLALLLDQGMDVECDTVVAAIQAVSKKVSGSDESNGEEASPKEKSTSS